MRSVFATLLVVALGAVALLWWLKVERTTPRVSLPAPLEVLGRTTPFEIDVHADRPLAGVRVELAAGDSTVDLLRTTYPAPGFIGGGASTARVQVTADLVDRRVPEGPATLHVFVETHAWRLRQPAGPTFTRPVRVDLTPPTIELLTTQHNVRLGGVGLAVFRQAADTTHSGIEVDRYFFPAITGYFADPTLALGFFAVPQDLDATARVRLVASDAAGNRREVGLPASIKPRRFPERTLPIDDAFLSRKVPEIERESRLPPSPSLLAGYLAINRDLRQRNEAQIAEITAQPHMEMLWDGVFHRQSNAAPLSAFADRRSYTYKGEVIDHQTHLGYDLASIKLSPVEATQHGIVVFADNLGIYGLTVVLDHGLGIFSLYGHLSTIAVQQGERVRRGQTIGQTGETGLAGGDHLHFSILLRGVHVDPVEWWDPKWLRDHITSKLTMFPRAAAQAVENAPPVEAVAPVAPTGQEHEQANP